MKVFLVLLSCFLALDNPFPVSGSDSRIVGGQDAVPGQFKYQVSLRVFNSHYCGGSIISPTRVLTAAHCNKGLFGLTIVAGTIDLTATPYEYQATEIINHENYIPSTKENDIAIINIKGQITFNDVIQPVGLPTYSIQPRTRAMASGWGYTSYPGSAPQTLQYLEVKIIASGRCKSTQICTLNKVEEGMCSGDSGGPLVSDGQLHGIASAAQLCALGLADYWTRVHSFNGWIEAHM